MKFFKLIFPYILFISLASCASYQSASEVDAPEKRGADKKSRVSQISSVDRSDGYYKFTLGMLAERKGDYTEAIKYYYQAAASDKSQVQAYKHAANLLLRLGDMKMARQAAKSGLKIDPNYPGCLEILGGIEFSQGRYEEAMKYFKRLVEVEPDARDPILYLAVSYLKTDLIQDAINQLKLFNEKFPHRPNGRYYTGRAYIRLKDWDKAEKVFSDLLEERPDFLKAYENLAWVYRVSGKPDQAIRIYRKYLTINPNEKSVLAKLEDTKLSKESSEKAEALLSELIKSSPKDIDLYFSLGLGQWRRAEMTGDIEGFHKALDQFQLVREGNPHNRQVAYYIASIFERIGLLNEAIETWKRIGKRGGATVRDVNLKIAELYERSGKPELALEHALKAVETDPKDPELRYFVGLLYNKLSDNKKAETYFIEAIRLKPEDEKYYFYLGVVYEKMKMYDKTIEKMKKAIALKPDHPNALNYLGYIYAEQGIHLDKAEERLVKALEIEPDNGYFIDSLGWIYYKQKHYKKALEWILTAVRNIPPDPTVLEHLGDIYVALGKPSLAMKAYERSLKAKAEDNRELDRETVRRKMTEVRKKTKEGTTQ